MSTRRPPPADDSRTPSAGGGNEPPPILGSWRALYAAVLAELLLVILLCGWLNRWGR